MAVRVHRPESQRGKLHRHNKKQKTVSNKKKNQTTETDPEITWMVDFVDKDSKTIDIILFHMIKNGEKSTSMLRRDM